jgi:hypothetical protein
VSPSDEQPLPTGDTPNVDPPPVLVDGDGNFIPETVPENAGAFISVDGAPAAPATPDPLSDEIDPVRILRDRPDVYAAFYSEFYGSHNDRNSHAWIDRVGGESPEDYARYWYNSYGRFEGYTPGTRSIGAPAEGSSDALQGRTTLDGIPVAKILSDRPDVFQAFFTEYYGAGNDRHSNAWVQRVGGTTVEDYANYWYNAHGKVSGYVPSAPPAAVTPDTILSTENSGTPEPTPTDGQDTAPPEGASPPGEALPPPLTEAIVGDEGLARPLAVHYFEDGVIEIAPATTEEITAMRTLFDDDMI